MTNPLLNIDDLPPFSQIKPEHVYPAVEEAIQACRDSVTTALASDQAISWDSLVEPMTVAGDRFSRLWSPISHLNAVKNSDELRAAYERCLPMLSEYSTWVGQHQGLNQAFLQLKASDAYNDLSTAQKKEIENTLRDFHLSGVDLPEEKKTRYGEIVARLSELSSTFSNNVLDATQGWSKLVTDERELAGLPESALAMTKQMAEAKSQQGYLLTLDIPVYLAIMTYADSRELRETFYRAYVTRASDQGPTADKWDNTAVIEEKLALRHELAVLLGFENYAEYSLATKMADSSDDVLAFLNQLAEKSRPQAQRELNELREYAAQTHGMDELQAWDTAYYAEKLKQARYAIDQEALRPYFPEDRVLSGLFEVITRLFGIRVVEKQGIDRWHEAVRYFELIDSDEQLRGSFYLDLYARENKRGGAWMDECRVRRKKASGEVQSPVAYLVCNFSQPVGGKPAMFTHDEVVTLFHEFGHGIHHMLTKVDIAGVSGINGVPWDAVELPSQFLENWCWEAEALSFISGHYETGEPLPDAMLNQLLAAKNFQNAMMMVRQLEFSLFDFLVHQQYDPAQGGRVQETMKQVREKVAVIIPPEFNRFQHSFTHIFAGGYAAGYYSYKWAEVLSADAFSRFEDEGIFNPQTGSAFLENILERGGEVEPMALFQAFRGRKPEIDALLRHGGIES